MRKSSRGLIGLGLAMALLMAVCLGLLLLGGRMMMPGHGHGTENHHEPQGDSPELEGDPVRR